MRFGGRRVLHVRRDGVGPTYYAPTYYASTYYAPTYYAPTYYAPTYYASTYYAPTYYASTYYASTYSLCLSLLTMPLPPWLQSQPPNSTHYAHASPHYD